MNAEKPEIKHQFRSICVYLCSSRVHLWKISVPILFAPSSINRQRHRRLAVSRALTHDDLGEVVAFDPDASGVSDLNVVSARAGVVERDDLVAEATNLPREGKVVDDREVGFNEIGYWSAVLISDYDEKVGR